MQSHSPAQAGPHLVQFNREIAGKQRIPRRLKAKHLAHSTRELIVRLFRSLESYDDVAREMDMPGLTGKTVCEVLDAWQMRMPPASARSMARRVTDSSTDRPFLAPSAA